MAPFTPFMAEDIYQKLTDQESVHLQNFPVHNAELVYAKVEEEMDTVRGYITEGLRLRAVAQLKVRQPLAAVQVPGCPKYLIDILKEELNVKDVVVGADAVSIDTKLTPALKREGLMREVIRQVQNARKAAGLNVDDRIQLSLGTKDAELKKAIKEHQDIIKAETLAKDLSEEKVYSYHESVTIEAAELIISLQK
jgi:isoleucyl-tRNA synthetase